MPIRYPMKKYSYRVVCKPNQLIGHYSSTQKSQSYGGKSRKNDHAWDFRTGEKVPGAEFLNGRCVVYLPSPIPLHWRSLHKLQVIFHFAGPTATTLSFPSK